MKLIRWQNILVGALLLMTALPAITFARNIPAALEPATGETSQSLAGAPLEVRSWKSDGLLVAEIDGLLDYPFSIIKNTLDHPEAWCKFIPLVFNVKSCVFQQRDGRQYLTLFVGRKFFEPPEDAIKLTYDFQVVSRESDRLQVTLTAKDGPWGTSDYHIKLDVLAATDGRTLVRMHSSFRPSLRSTIATRIYLATTGQSKVGFSVEEYDDNQPIYVGGVKGIIERNVMRYYLALKAFLDTQHLPVEKRFHAQLEAWYGYTEKYKRQLYEMERQDYVETKKRERACQRQLQEEMG